jgi:AbrB family looped-hinge helix DNA binding protein
MNRLYFLPERYLAMKMLVVTTKGQVVIPSKLRRKYHIEKGTQLYVEDNGNEIILRPITPEYIKKLAGILPSKGELTRDLLRERALDKEREK